MKKSLVFFLWLFTYLPVNAATINGTVTDRKTHETLSDANVIISRMESMFDTLDVTVTANDGSFEFTDLDRATYYLISVSLPGYKPDNDNFYKITGNDTVTVRIGLTQEENKTVSGMVTDVDDNPVSDALVILQLGPDEDQIIPSAITGDDGSYSIVDIPPEYRKAQVGVTAEGFQTYFTDVQMQQALISLDNSLEEGTTGIVDKTDETTYKIYINESGSGLHIDNIRTSVRLTVHGLSGRVLENCVLPSGSHLVFLRNVDSGTVLFISLQDAVSRTTRIVFTP